MKQIEGWNLISEAGTRSADDIALGLRIDSVAAGVSTLNKNQQLLINPRYIFISDSYGGHPTANTSWIDLLATKLGLDSDHHVDLWEGGSCFTSTSYPTILEQLQTYTATISDDDKEKITHIVVGCGYNEAPMGWGDLSQLYGALSTFATYCKSNYPNANVYLGMIGRSFNNPQRNEELLSVFRLYSACNDFGIRYLTGVESSLCFADYFNADGIHPSASGASSIANSMYNALTVGDANVYTNIIDSIITPASGVNMITASLQMSVKNDMISISFNNWNTKYNQFTFDTPFDVSILGSTLVNLGSITNNCTIGAYKERTLLECTALLIDSTNTNHLCSIAIIISSNTLFVRFYPETALTQVKAMFFPNISREFKFIET